EKETREKLEQEQVRVITEAHWVLENKIELPKPKFQVEYESSFLQMESTERSSIGRVSFQNFNEEVERSALKKSREQRLDRELKRERHNEIDDVDMANQLGNKAKKLKTSTSPSTSKKPISNRRAPPQSNNQGSQKMNGGNSSGNGTSETQRTFMKPKE
ncbi:hypothetical protein BX616_005720, partial [Lobosporangium transversale]